MNAIIEMLQMEMLQSSVEGKLGNAEEAALNVVS